MKKYFVIAFLLLHCMAAMAESTAATQNHAQIKRVAADFVRQQSASLAGKVSYKIGDIDRRITMPACPRIEAFLPAGSPFIGNTSVGVRCMKNNGWSIFVPVQIKVSLNLLLSARQLPSGHVLQKQDLISRTIEVSQTEGLTDPKQAIGMVLRYSIAAGQILRETMLRQPFSVKQGQIVHLVVQGDGFSIRSEGAALANAGEGRSVRIRSISGRVIGGVAQANGEVEIEP